MRRVVFLTTLLATWCLIAATNVQAATRIIYVDANAPGLNNGSSWANAYRFLQDALADANTAADVNEIRIAQGIYRPDQGRGVALMDRTATFCLRRSMAIRGGYAGAGWLDPNRRDVDAHPTVLTGDLARNDGPISESVLLKGDPTRSDNAGRLLSIETTEPITLEGLTVTGSYSLDLESAALYTEGRQGVTVIDCTFVSNVGGGIHSLYGDLTVLRCHFVRNWSLEGGGGIACREGLFTIRECMFIENIACSNCCDVGFGGAFYSPGYVTGSVIEDCTFIGNSAAEGGAVALGGFGWSAGYFNPNLARIVGCTMINNRAGWCGSGGGAISIGGTALTVRDCMFSENTSERFGGAISTDTGELDLSNCVFIGNLAKNVGGCLFAFGPIVRRTTHTDFRVTLNNCTCANNRAPAGRTLSCSTGYPQSSETGQASISNCILDNGGSEIQNQTYSQIAISYSNVRGGLASIYDPCEGVIWGEGNIDGDSLFAKPGYWDPNGTPADANDDFWVDGDYHLKSQVGRWDPNSLSWVADNVTSPCIDAGDPNTPVGDEPQPNGGRINIGTYGGTPQASKSGGKSAGGL